MKPAPFEYAAPPTIGEALQELTRRHAQGEMVKLLAGGQSLIPAMNFRLSQPGALLDLNGIAELSFIRPGQNGGLVIGAMTRHSTIERNALAAERAPLLRLMAPHIAHPQIRNRGTFGGSLAHADPSGHWPAAAAALEARLHLVSARGDRWVNADDFFISLYTTALEPDEILTEIAIPPLPPRRFVSYQQVARQHGAFPLAGVIAIVTPPSARLVFLSLGEKPMVGAQAAKALHGRPFDANAIEAAAQAAARFDIDPTGDIHASAAYRRRLAAVLTRRALQQIKRDAERTEGK